jgi:hypothetical protein
MSGERLGQSGYIVSNFGIELYKGEWIARIACPNDQPIGENEAARAAADYWLANNRKKFEEGRK